MAPRRSFPDALAAPIALALLAALVGGGAIPGGGASARAEDLPPTDPFVLPALLDGAGFAPPEDFKALVLLPDADGEGPAFDWCGTSDDRGDWWPASSVKIFAAIAALERSRGLGFPPEVWVRYHYDREPGAPEDASSVAYRLSGMVHRAIAPSSNADFDRLVELVGLDAMHRGFFTEENGLEDTAFRRAYTGRLRDPETDLGIFGASPPLSLYLGRRRRELPARPATVTPDCPDLGNCTTLADLAEAMRRVMFHGRLPPEERFDLGPPELEVLRGALSGERPRGNGLPAAVQRGVGEDVSLRFFHKPGYALRWISEVLLVEWEDTGRRAIIAAAARPHRRALDDALEAIGRLLARDAFDAVGSAAEMLDATGREVCRRPPGDAR